MTDTLIIMFFGVFAVVWLISGFLTLRNQQDVLGRPPIAGGWFLLGKLTMGVSWGCLLGAALGMHRPIGAYSGYTDWLSLLSLTVAMVFVATSFFVLGAANKFGLPQEKTVLKTKGVYAVSRNPMYVGFYLMCLASVLYVPHPINLISTVIAIGVHHQIVLAEERFLALEFRQAWENYCTATRRYL